MKKTYGLLLAQGSNEIIIPARIFKTFDEGKKFMDNLFKSVTEDIGRVEVLTGKELKKSHPHINVKDDARVTFYNIIFLGTGMFDPDDFDSFHHKVMNELFTNYYGGCGECELLILIEADYDDKITSFDLD
jgi:hypothetical protein